MRIAVFGAGGVGGYFGGRLAQAGREVAFVARGPHLAALRRDGLQVASLAGDFMVRPVEASDRPADLGPVDAVLVCVKAWQVPAAAAAMPPLLGPETFVVPLQNGVEAADQLATALGRERVVGGMCRIVAFQEGPGRIRHAGVPPSIEIGEIGQRGGGSSHRVEALRAAFTGTIGVRVGVPDDIEAAVWEKLLFIAPFSGVGALTGHAAGAMRRDPAARAMLEAAMAEVAALAAARGIVLRPDVVARNMAFVDAMPADATASMQRDLAAGRPSELEGQVGAVVRLAAEAGLPVPVHRRIYEGLLPAERAARARAGG